MTGGPNSVTMREMAALHIYTSTISDGAMKSTDGHYASVLPARQTFLEKHAIAPADTTLVQLAYEGDDYTRYQTVADHDRGDGIVRPASIISDALVTTRPGHALFLPLADCIGAVIHDPTRNILMLSHLGRHNLEQDGGKRSIEYLVGEHNVRPENLTVWLSPAAGGNNYPLYSFDSRSLHDVAIEQLLAAGGIDRSNIARSDIDTTTHPDYYSHSQAIKDRGPHGRFAVIAVLS